MNQIAIGDSSSWTVLEGQAITAPFRRSALFFSGNADPFLQEKIEISLAGTPVQISAALGMLENINLRARAYARSEYPYPQMLRFQPIAGGSYFYAQISDIALEASPDSYRAHQRGSYLVTLHYTRPNYFDGDQVELPLTGRDGTDVTGGFDLFNHTDSDAPHGSTALIKAADAVSDLPAPLRIELLNNYAADTIKDIYFGIYHHPTVTAEEIFFAYAPDLAGGTQYVNANAIQGYYRRKSWTASTWTALFTYPIPLSEVDDLDGRTYRPLLHLYNSHAYTDFYLQIKLHLGVYTMQSCEPVYADPDYDYVLFPPIQIPPNQILRENPPHSMDVTLYGLKADGAAAQIDIDQICFLPLDYGAFFQGFFHMGQNDKFIYDNFRDLSNMRYAAGQTEAVAYIRQGGPLLLHPNNNSRLFVVLANQNNTIDIMRSSVLRVYYRPRVRLL